MKTYLLSILLLLLSFDTYCQSDTFVMEPDLVLNFNKCINKTKLNENGLMIKEIQTFYTCLDKNDSNTYPYSFLEMYTKQSDSILSILETDSTLSVRFVIFDSSFPTISWETDVYVQNSDTLNIKCIPLEQAMSHRPMYSPVCVTINFDKLFNLSIKTVVLNKKD